MLKDRELHLEILRRPEGGHAVPRTKPRMGLC